MIIIQKCEPKGELLRGGFFSPGNHTNVSNNFFRILIASEEFDSNAAINIITSNER